MFPGLICFLVLLLMEFASPTCHKFQWRLLQENSDYSISSTLRPQDLASQVPPGLELYGLREAPAMTLGLGKRPDGQEPVAEAREEIFVAKDCSRPKSNLILLLSLLAYRCTRLMNSPILGLQKSPSGQTTKS